MTSEAVAPTGERGLAVVVSELVRQLSAERAVHAAALDFTAWLQDELCRARGWTVADILRAWQLELDRRAHDRAVVRGEAA